MILIGVWANSAGFDATRDEAIGSRLVAALARGDGRYATLLKQFARVDLLILDDWGPEPLLPEQQRDLLEIVEDRYGPAR